MDYLIDCQAGQADVVVKYHENLDLFTVMSAILDKLTLDHQYYLYNSKKSTDVIYCYPEFVKENPDLPYHPRDETGGSALLDFTVENMKYVGVNNSDYKADAENITIYGEVTEDGLFAYDYPVISREMDKKYYEMTRGHNVRRIKLDPESLEYMIDPEFEKYYQVTVII